MIVLGVAPGLGELAYSVLAYHAGATQADPVDSDVLHAGRGPLPTSAFQVLRRTHVHHMILGVVCERWTPALVVLGPAVRPKEPPEHVDSVRQLIRIIAVSLSVPVVDLPDKDAMLSALGAEARSWRNHVADGLRSPMGSQDRRIVLATATGIAGWRAFKGYPPAP